MRGMRQNYNINTVIRMLGGLGDFQFFQLTLFLTLSNYSVHEIINGVWTSTQEKTLSSTFKLFSLCMRIFFPTSFTLGYWP